MTDITANDSSACSNKTERTSQIVLETERLTLRRLSVDDAEFMLRLLNEPSFVQNIGDKGVRTIEEARAYIQNGPVASYKEFGFGLWLVEIKHSGSPIGICGVLKRAALEDADLGYALVPEYWSQGYALEAASAVMDYAGRMLGLRRLAAIVNHDNQSSLRLLRKMGFTFAGMIRLSSESEEIQLLVANIHPS